MLSQAVALALQLPPLAFGPVRPPDAFALPRILVCAVGELGLLKLPERPLPLVWIQTSLNLRGYKPAPERYFVNRPVDILMALATLYAGRGTWDETPWSVRTWQATGAAAPLLIPPQPPPFLAVQPH